MARTLASISALEPSTLNLGAVSAGRGRTSAGKSHSWLRPTCKAPHPRPCRISVALAIRLTMRGWVAAGIFCLALRESSGRALPARHHRAAVLAAVKDEPLRDGALRAPSLTTAARGGLRDRRRGGRMLRRGRTEGWYQRVWPIRVARNEET